MDKLIQTIRKEDFFFFFKQNTKKYFINIGPNTSKSPLFYWSYTGKQFNYFSLTLYSNLEFPQRHIFYLQKYCKFFFID